MPAKSIALRNPGILLHTTLYGKPRNGEVMLETVSSTLRRATCHPFPSHRSRSGSSISHPARQASEIARKCRILKRTQGDSLGHRNPDNARMKKVLAALEGNWQAEMEGYHTYPALADRDTDPVRAQVLRHLAAAELEHAALWARPHHGAGRPGARLSREARRRCRFARQPRGRRPHGPAPP